MSILFLTGMLQSDTFSRNHPIDFSSSSFSAKSLQRIQLEDIPEVTVKYYEIQGQTFAELRREMDAKGPVDQFGRHRDAYTFWHIYWTWSFGDCKNSSRKNCPDFETTSAAYRVVVTLPRWSDYPEADPKLQREWTGYIRAVRAHEKNHVAHVVGNYRKAVADIRSAAGVNPSLTSGEANQIGNAVLERVRYLDKEYDRRTKNGAREGIVLR